jgi:hypothetical protein
MVRDAVEKNCKVVILLLFSFFRNPIRSILFAEFVVFTMTTTILTSSVIDIYSQSETANTHSTSSNSLNSLHICIPSTSRTYQVLSNLKTKTVCIQGVAVKAVHLHLSRSVKETVKCQVCKCYSNKSKNRVKS